MYFCSSLRGKRPYWSELQEMVNQIGTPRVFFTLSAADYNWHDLYRLLKSDNDITELTESERKQIMHENPILTA